MISLATPRTLLRPWTSDDLDPFVELSLDTDVMKYIGDGKPKSPEAARSTFAQFPQSWDENGFGLLAIERLDTGEFAGFTGLLIPDFLPEILPAVEVGWRLTRSSWGLGLGSEAAGAMVDWAFESLGLERVVSVIQVENVRSQRLADRLGMQRERRTIVPNHGVWADVYELHASQWQTMSRQPSAQ
jgi:RimJ/RimL family protein N-acetyltransferase